MERANWTVRITLNLRHSSLFYTPLVEFPETDYPLQKAQGIELMLVFYVVARSKMDFLIEPF